MSPESSHKKVTLALPCYNPIDSQWANLERFLDVDLKDFTAQLQVIVVDDGSPRWVAPSPALQSKIKLIRSEKNEGKGGALQRAIAAMDEDALVFAFLDFDLPYTAADLKGVVASVLQGADACIGDRSLNFGSHRFTRAMSHKLFRLFMRMLVTGGVPDTQCGVKAYDAKALRRITKIAKINGFLFDVEWIYIGLKHRMAFRYWPVQIEESHESTPLRRFGVGRLFGQLRTLIVGILNNAYVSKELFDYLSEKRELIKKSLN